MPILMDFTAQNRARYSTVPWNTDAYASNPEAERLRREREEFWTRVAGLVVAGAVVLGLIGLLAAASR